MKVLAWFSLLAGLAMQAQIITTVAGSSTWGTIEDVAVDAAGSLLITDASRQVIYRADWLGAFTVIAGTGTIGYSGDGGPTSRAQLWEPVAIAVGPEGSIFVTDYGNHRVRRIFTDGLITNVAGNGIFNFSGDGGCARDAQIYDPSGLALDLQGNLLVVDTGNQRVRRISLPAGPVLRSVAPSFLGKSGFSSNTYLELYGENFSAITRTWTGSDFQNGLAPTRLNGVSVEVNSRPAFVYFISPNQININTPDDASTGPVAIRVTTPNGTSSSLIVQRERLSPTLQTVPQFQVGNRQYVVAQTPDFSRFIGTSGLIANVPFAPARPGETVILFALGCGPTTPGTSAGQPSSGNAQLALPYQFRIGNQPAEVRFGGMVVGTIGLYQFNVVVPNVAAGDQPIELTVDGVRNGQELVISVGDR